MTIILEVTESEEEIIFGIPYYLTITSSSPSNIYYTLDGTDPNENSFLVDGDVYLPTNISTFTFKCKAITANDSSEIFEDTYSAANADVQNTRKGNEAGVVVMTQNSTVLESLSVDSNGNPAQESSISFTKLELKASKDRPFFRKLKDTETTLEFINFAKTNVKVDALFSVDTPNNNVEFNPLAKVIHINGTTPEDILNQEVNIINRTYGNLNPASKYYVENESNFRSIITGNLCRYVYDSNTGKIVFYYYDSRESRWVISSQKTEAKKLHINFNTPKNFVYKWIKDPVMSKIF